MREMYLEQSTYFSLMQKCQRNTSSTSCLLKFFNLSYWIISDYGQSVTRPIIGLLLTFLMSIAIFSSLGVEKINAPYLSLTQILKPYSLLYDREPRVLLDKLCLKDLSETDNTTLIKSDSQPACASSLAQYKYGWLFIITSLLESTLSLVFLACLVLALRWNFRKA